MNSIFKYILILQFLIIGCKSSVVREKNNYQKIDSLDMIIYSNKGDKIYSINSPSSIYDKVENTFYFGKTTINLFKDEKKEYIIYSNESRLFNNNKELELNGDVELRTVLQDNDILNADKFYWNIDDYKYILTGDVKFENNNILLSSNKATLNTSNIIEFYNPVKYIIKNDDNENSYEINSENAFYNINSKSVSFTSKEKRVRSKIYF